MFTVQVRERVGRQPFDAGGGRVRVRLLRGRDRVRARGGRRVYSCPPAPEPGAGPRVRPAAAREPLAARVPADPLGHREGHSECAARARQEDASL